MTNSPATVRVGTDLCSVAAVDHSIRDFGRRYLERIYTPDELAYAESSPHQCSERLAARFAAKEAVIKVLRPEQYRPAWRSIEIRRHSTGWCDVELSGEAARLADQVGIVDLALSLTHESDMAAATVVAMVRSSTDHRENTHERRS